MAEVTLQDMKKVNSITALATKMGVHVVILDESCQDVETDPMLKIGTQFGTYTTNVFKHELDIVLEFLNFFYAVNCKRFEK